MKRHDRVGALLAISLILATLAGCSSLRMPDVNMPKLRWPFSAKPVPAPEPVDEVIFEAPAELSPATVVAFPQYFKRNTLIMFTTDLALRFDPTRDAGIPADWRAYSDGLRKRVEAMVKSTEIPDWSQKPLAIGEADGDGPLPVR